MRRHLFSLRSISASFVLLLLVSAVPSIQATEPAATPPVAADVPRAAVPAETGAKPEKPVYGPILAKDAAVRAEIKRLYIELHEFTEATYARVKELSEQARLQRDPDFHHVLQIQIAEAKLGLERRNLEIGLHIARLNGDKVRVEEFEKALDQLLHPEKYRTTASPDRAVEQRVTREQGAK